MTVTNGSYEITLKLDKKTAEAFKEAIEDKDVPENLKKCTVEGTLATVDEIKWLYANKKETTIFHELVCGCQIQLPKRIEAPRNPELEARIQKLKAEQEEREYRRMTKNVENSKRNRIPEESIGFQLRMINRQLIAVLQFVFSVATGFLFGFLGVQMMTGELDFGFRLLLGVICALIVALAEIYFLAKKLAEEDEQYLPRSSSGKVHQD